MGRWNTAKRVAGGIPFLIAYTVVLFPAIFLLSIVFGAVDAGWHLVTGNGTRLADWSSRLWDWNGSNARWALTGRGSFDWTP